jgi:hypothetical protein
MRLWDIEGSLDGSTWREIGRQMDNDDFKERWNTASFAVSTAATFRSIRLTQTGQNHKGND